MATIPRYARLKQLLKDKIVEDKLSVGDRFYSQNALMKRYGLSFATVSRALNDLEREGFLTRQQGRGTFVKAIPSESDLAAKQQRNIGVFIPWDFRNPAHINFQRLFAAFEEALPEHFSAQLMPYGQRPESLEQYLFARKPLDAFVFAYPSEAHVPHILRFARSHPIVVIGRAIESDQLSSVRVDNEKAAREAVEYLLGLGHREIGMISNDLLMSDARERLEGYRSALRNRDLPYTESLVVYTRPFELNGYSGLIDLLDRNAERHVTAVFAAGDLIALGALSAARVMKLEIPQDISIIGFDDIDEAMEFDPPLSTVRVPIRDLGRRAAECLSALLENRAPHRHLELNSAIVERSSTGPPPRLRAAGANKPLA